MKLITTHLNADFDCLASMVAAEKIFPGAKMVFSGSTEKAVKEYLETVNPPFHFSKIKDIDLEVITDLVLVDTQDPERIGVFKSLLGKKEVKVHIYDHHPSGEAGFEVEQAVIRNRGSSTTILCEILNEKNIQLSSVEATLMALGIYQDTHSLTSPSSTPEDFVAVSALVRMGADLNVVADFMQARLNQDQRQIMNDLISNLELQNFNGVEIGLATASADRYVGDLAAAVHQIMELENLNTFFALIRLGDRVCMIARSRTDKVNVAEIAKEFSGGGHAYAASATIREQTLIQVRETLISSLADKVEPVARVRDVMHFPVVSVNGDDNVQNAEKVMTRFNLNTLPVLLNKKPVGLITRQIVEKAIHHGMSKEKIEDIMIREFMMTSPDAWFKSIVPIIIEEKQKLVPVVDSPDENLVGVVSRGDLLRALHREKEMTSAVGYAGLLQGKSLCPKNMKSLMNERLSKNTMNIFGTIGCVADRMGMSAYVVGGFVRDLLLRIENLDIDIVVEGDGIRFACELGKEFGSRVRSHEKFGTSVVILDEGMKLDIATARIEYYQKPAALPTVDSGSIKSDLFRRDFAFNSLAIGLNGKDAFTLLDFFNGQRDLKDKMVRVLHNLSFIEDPCRAFRAVRFEQRFKFSLGKQTEAFLKNAVKKKLVDRLSGHRLFNELVSILKEKNPLDCVLRMDELNLLQFIHPNLLKSPNSWDHLEKIGDVLSLSKMIPHEGNPDEWMVYLLAMLNSLNEEDFNQAADRLGLSIKLKNRFKEDLNGCRKTLELLKTKSAFSPSEIYEMFAGLSPEALMLMSAISNSKTTNKYVLLYYSEYDSLAAFSLTGDDLIKMGIKPGPVFKSVFKSLRDAHLNGSVKSREDEMALVEKEYLNS